MARLVLRPDNLRFAMIENGSSQILQILTDGESSLVEEWIAEREATLPHSGSQLRPTCREFVRHFREGVLGGDLDNLDRPEWSGLRAMLKGLSEQRGRQGYTPTETATFVFSFKKPLITQFRAALSDDPTRMLDQIWQVTTLLDQLGLWTTEVHQQTREAVILRQQEEMTELSTPVVKLWEGILALPLIGTLDSSRSQVVMESLLQRIVETGSPLAIIDITGVPVVDTLVAQQLLKTITAARLMGADCIISGIRPQIAQTIVHLGVDLAGVITKATLADALALAMRRLHLQVTRVRPTPPPDTVGF